MVFRTMLTRELLRFKVSRGVVEPQLLRGTAGELALIAELLACWRGHVGRTVGEIEEALLPVVHRSRALLVARGLAKLMREASSFADPEDAAGLRQRACAASAALLQQVGFRSAEEHQAAVACELGIEVAALRAGLYGDHPDRAVLTAAPAAEAEAWLQRYNLALCQGLLLGAESIEVAVPSADPGTLRRLLAALRFRRLIAEARLEGVHSDGGAADSGVTGDSAVRPGAGSAESRRSGSDAIVGRASRPRAMQEHRQGLRSARLLVRITGPGAVLDQSARYGLQFAQLLPALAALPEGWSARATVSVRSRFGPGSAPGGAQGVLALGSELRLPGDAGAALGFIPAELRSVGERLAERLGLRCVDPEPILLASGELIAPDFAVEVAASAGQPARVFAIELFHRWHDHALPRRLAQLSDPRCAGLLIGVDRALAKRERIAALLAEHTVFAARGFLFSDIPAPRPIAELIARCMQPA